MSSKNSTIKIGAAIALIASVTFAESVDTDIVIYGSSPAAISAAVQAKRMGRSCVIVSPETRIGGLTTGGLGQTDIGNKAAFGGIALEFYRDVAKWYADEKHWTRQKPTEYFPDGQCAGSKDGGSMWTFEPSAVLAILEGWEKRDGLDIHRGKLLDRGPGKVKLKGEGEQRKIVSFLTLDGTEYRGKMFIDATYEGDLMAAAGVSYAVGREANSVYGETINGNVSTEAAGAWNHGINDEVSAYVKPGDRSSGLLPGVEPYNPDEKPGDGDKRVQAYCFRMCLTDDPGNRIPFMKPVGYDERNYELLFRDFEKGFALSERPSGARAWKWEWCPSIMSKMPNRKTDSNNRCGFSTDFIGANWNWPEATYAEREQMLKAHLDYQMGLMWTLANHPRIPEVVREYFSKYGTCKDEFLDGLGSGWQRQLYVREARRMIGDYVMTEHNCRGKVKASRPVALGAYTMDSHHVRRVETKDGFVRNEGNVEDHGFAGPYPIDYGAIIPKRGECSNLFVPVCLSASHVAFGSIRMEPVFFALGQVAGTAAAQAIDANCAVQDLPYAPLARRLLADGQILEIDPPRKLLVAAANSPAYEKAKADYVCDGVNDESEINMAISRLVYGGTIRLADGEYHIDSFKEEGNSAINFGYNGGKARVIRIKGTTENKSYNTRYGVTLLVTKNAMGAMKADETYRVFYGCARKPEPVGDFYTYTHLNNVNFENFYLYFDNASKRLIGIDGRLFGSMDIDLVGIYQKSYFNDRFMHIGAPDIPCDGTVGVYSVPSSNDEMARCCYKNVNVGGLYRGFVFDGVDHLIMSVSGPCRCVYGYWFESGAKTMTILNCCDEGNLYLPYFKGKGHVTMIDFNIERFNAKFIPTDCRGERSEHGAVEETPGAWQGSISYTLQGGAFGLGNGGGFQPGRFWAEGSGKRFKTRDLNNK